MKKQKVYSPGQLSVVYPFLPRAPKWLLLGGPACANEAQTARAKWPGIRVVGVDPNPDVAAWQQANGWPEGQPLVHAALWDSVGVVPMANAGSDLLHASVHHGEAEQRPTCLSVTWDALDIQYGPFEDALLWMDIEGSELEALRGAEQVLPRVLLINVELLTRPEEKPLWARNDAIDALLAGHGFKAVKDWNDSDWCRDRIYVRG